VIFTFSPPLYSVRKIPIQDILNDKLRKTEDYLVKQQDNQLFRQIRLITNNYSEFNDYFIFIDCSGYRKKKAELKQIIQDGITIKNQHFVLSERSASMCRQAELGFIDESISDKINEIVGMGLSLQSTIISKYYAYRGLMLSSCFCLEDWLPQIIIVDDFTVTIPNQHIRFLADAEPKEYIDRNTKEKKVWRGKEVKDGYKDLEVLAWDGCGLIHPELALEIKNKLNIINENPTSIMIRMPFVKGIVHAIDYAGFWYEHGIHQITDIYGHKWDSQGKYIILTKSQYKGFKYFSSFDEYLQQFKKYNYCIGVAKWNYSIDNEPRWTRASYQILQTLDLPYDEFKQIADYSKNVIEKVVGGDEFYTYAFLGLLADNLKPQNDYMKAILKNPEMLKDPQIHKYLSGILQKTINDMKCGKLWVKGGFKILASDLVMLMQRIAGLEAEGVLDDDEFWAKNYEGTCKGKYVINRNPHIAASESVVLRGSGYNKWYGHLDNVVMVNAKSITLARLSGADLDGDLALVSNDKLLLQGINPNNIPIVDVEDKKTAKDKEINLDNLIESIIFSFSNKIGEYSNMATTFLNRTPKTEECKQHYLDNVDYISVLNGKEIDRAKTGVEYYCPKYISKDSKPLPYFMKYASPYYMKLKLNVFESNMNLMCWELEKWENTIKTRKKKFNYSIMIDKTIPKDEEKFIKIYDLYLKFREKMDKLRLFQFKLHKYKKLFDKLDFVSKHEIESKQINWEKHYQPFREQTKLICPNEKELANYVVEICYKMFPKNAKNFAWVVAKNGLIENIEQVNISLPIADKKGELDFLGRKFSLENSAVY
jgi:hypothetical protein